MHGSSTKINDVVFTGRGSLFYFFFFLFFIFFFLHYDRARTGVSCGTLRRPLMFVTIRVSQSKTWRREIRDRSRTRPKVISFSSSKALRVDISRALRLRHSGAIRGDNPFRWLVARARERESVRARERSPRIYSVL